MTSRDWKEVAIFTFVLIAAELVLIAGTYAQIPSASTRTKIAWDEGADTLVQANSQIYRVYTDGQTTPIVLAGVLCVAPGAAGQPFVCTASFPALVPGAHTLTVTAGTDTAESLPSTPFSFQYVVIPAQPKNVRIA